MLFSKKKKQKSREEEIAALRTNYAGESMDELDKDGNLPFGWVLHNRNYVDMIEHDMQPFREAVRNAKTDIEKYGALKSYMLFFRDGKKHYSEMGECVGKYFEEYICKSMEAKQIKEKYQQIEKKLKGQK